MNTQDKKLARLYVEYDQHETGGEAINPDDEWPSFTTRVKEVKFTRLHISPPSNRFFYDSVECDERMLKLDKLYLCVIRYSTGNTFGQTEGAWEIIGVAPTYKIADAMLKEALNSTGYKPWEGYFESFSGVEIHELNVV